jgi:hypothetical protein
MNIKSIVPLAILFSAINLFGQNSIKNTVILYNLVPLRVDLDRDGTIKQMYGADYNFLKGYTVVRPKVETNQDNYSKDPSGSYVVVTENYDITFSSNNAILTKSSLESLDKTADESFFNEHKILIHPYRDNGSNSSKTLLKNRLNAVLIYLELKGIPKDKIIISVDAVNLVEESIKISFVK